MTHQQFGTENALPIQCYPSKIFMPEILTLAKRHFPGACLGLAKIFTRPPAQHRKVVFVHLFFLRSFNSRTHPPHKEIRWQAPRIPLGGYPTQGDFFLSLITCTIVGKSSPLNRDAPRAPLGSPPALTMSSLSELGQTPRGDVPASSRSVVSTLDTPVWLINTISHHQLSVGRRQAAAASAAQKNPL